MKPKMRGKKRAKLHMQGCFWCHNGLRIQKRKKMTKGMRKRMRNKMRNKTWKPVVAQLVMLFRSKQFR